MKTRKEQGTNSSWYFSERKCKNLKTVYWLMTKHRTSTKCRSTTRIFDTNLSRDHTCHFVGTACSYNCCPFSPPTIGKRDTSRCNYRRFIVYAITLLKFVVSTCSVCQVILFRETGVVHRITYSLIIVFSFMFHLFILFLI